MLLGLGSSEVVLYSTIFHRDCCCRLSSWCEKWWYHLHSICLLLVGLGLSVLLSCLQHLFLLLPHIVNLELHLQIGAQTLLYCFVSWTWAWGIFLLATFRLYLCFYPQPLGRCWKRRGNGIGLNIGHPLPLLLVLRLLRWFRRFTMSLYHSQQLVRFGTWCWFAVIDVVIILLLIVCNVYLIISHRLYGIGRLQLISALLYFVEILELFILLIYALYLLPAWFESCFHCLEAVLLVYGVFKGALACVVEVGLVMSRGRCLLLAASAVERWWDLWIMRCSLVQLLLLHAVEGIVADLQHLWLRELSRGWSELWIQCGVIPEGVWITGRLVGDK